jgi:hypothetical protein
MVLSQVSRLYNDYLSDAVSLGDILNKYDPMFLLTVVSAGRAKYANALFGNIDKNYMDYLIGSGLSGAIDITDGKVGIEMDVLDAFNIYGVVGVFILFSFYYIPIFRMKLPYYSKIIFFVVVLYSVFGGHLINNPLCNVYYAIFLGLLCNKNKILTKEFYALRHGHEYSSTIQGASA